MKSGRIVNIFFALAFVALGVFAAIYLYRDYQHLDHLKSEEQVLDNRLNSLEKAATDQQKKLDWLEGDSEYVEKVIREKLNYVKEDEDVFRFE